jgi:hypothetical protein
LRDRHLEEPASQGGLEFNQGGNGYGFFLAMAHWQLGDKDQARQGYDESVEWMDKHQPGNAELRCFRAEAAELLGIQEAPPPGLGKKPEKD